MYHAGIPCGANDFLICGDSNANILHPGGANGVASAVDT